MFTGVRSIAVYAADKARALEFYTRILGFELVFDLGPDLCFLKSKNGKVDIYLEGGMKPHRIDSQTCRLGVFLQAEKPAAEIYEQLKAAGVRLLQAAPEQVDDDTACFQLEDPDGNIIDVCGSV